MPPPGPPGWRTAVLAGHCLPERGSALRRCRIVAGVICVWHAACSRDVVRLHCSHSTSPRRRIGHRWSVGENMDELAQHITEYAATVDEANKRTLDPIIIELMRGRGLT